MLSHSGDHGPLDTFAGKEVAVLGSGASATDLAASLHEKGAVVSLIARTAKLDFAPPHRAMKSLLRRLVYPLRQLLQPSSGIGSGWLLKVCADAPWVIHALPEQWRLHIVRTALGPLGQSSMRDRVVGKVPLFLGRNLESAEAVNGRVNLRLPTRDGTIEALQTDHVIAATGYKIDLSNLEFLDSRLLSRIRTIDGAPFLSANYESSIPGLYFMGPASANSFGPVARFAFGAIHPSRRIVRHISRTLGTQLSFVSNVPRAATV